MAKAPKVTGKVLPPDFDKAKSIFDNDIAPANKAQKQAMSEASGAWKEVKGVGVHVGGFRTAAKVAKMEMAEQQAWLRSFSAGLSKFHVTLAADLADQAAGVNAETVPVVPTDVAPPELSLVH